MEGTHLTAPHDKVSKPLLSYMVDGMGASCSRPLGEHVMLMSPEVEVRLRVPARRRQDDREGSGHRGRRRGAGDQEAHEALGGCSPVQHCPVSWAWRLSKGDPRGAPQPPRARAFPSRWQPHVMMTAATSTRRPSPRGLRGPRSARGSVAGHCELPLWGWPSPPALLPSSGGFRPQEAVMRVTCTRRSPCKSHCFAWRQLGIVGRSGARSVCH